MFLFPLYLPGFLPNYLLPDYEEVVNRPPTPPPPYSALHTVSSTVPSSPLSGEQQEGNCHTVQSTPAVPVSDTLCPRPSLEEADPGGVGFLPKLDNKSPHMAQDLGTITRSDGVLLDGLAGEGRASSEKRERGTGDPCKEPLLDDPGDLEGSAEEKRLLPTAGRRRQFTGDSGIEVCVCGGVGGGSSGAGVQEDGELKELESLLGCTEEEEAEGGGGGEFCESCGPCGHLSEDEEQAQDGPERVLDQEPSAEPQPTHQTTSSSSSSSSSSGSSGSSNAPPMCALPHAINEQEGPHHGAEPQG